jgi:para-nitrobenzyl esterase
MNDHRLSRRCVLARGLTGGIGLLSAGCIARPGATKISTKRSDESPIAATAYGKVRGAVDNDIHVFKGIAYGDDTSGRRFMAPAPPKPWTGVRDALAFGPRAPQPAPQNPTTNRSAESSYPVSEDCLYLNVWTPGLRDRAKRAVMVYIHGGGYNALSANNPMYDGVRLCRRGDVVVVTLNHRLNLFGYLYLKELGGPDFADSGNVGQLDLILALQWVRDNIAEFGGDPSRVMIFGESGGGAKNACLMAMPGAMGLFHAAASSSGETVTASKPETATGRARQVLEALQLTPQTIDQIRTMPMDRLITASRASGYYGPVVDGRALPRHPFSPDATPISAHIPFMVGTNHDEARVLVGRGNPAAFDLTWETLPAMLKRYSEKMGNLDIEKDVIAMYRRLDPSASASDVLFRASTDSRDWRPALVEIERRAALPKGSAPTYSYQLDWWSPVDGGKWRAHHALDIPFLFDNVALANTSTGTSPDAYWMAEQISETYIAYAKTGNPNNKKIPKWPAYDLEKRATMVFDKVSHIVNDPRSEPRKLFSQVPYENPGT